MLTIVEDNVNRRSTVFVASDTMLDVKRDETPNTCDRLSCPVRCRTMPLIASNQLIVSDVCEPAFVPSAGNILLAKQHSIDEFPRISSHHEHDKTIDSNIENPREDIERSPTEWLHSLLEKLSDNLDDDSSK
jgi:hypothetical protein